MSVSSLAVRNNMGIIIRLSEPPLIPISSDNRSSTVLYDTWKQLIYKSNLRTIMKYSNKEAARRGEKDFGLNLQESEAFVIF